MANNNILHICRGSTNGLQPNEEIVMGYQRGLKILISILNVLVGLHSWRVFNLNETFFSAGRVLNIFIDVIENSEVRADYFNDHERNSIWLTNGWYLYAVTDLFAN